MARRNAAAPWVGVGVAIAAVVGLGWFFARPARAQNGGMPQQPPADAFDEAAAVEQTLSSTENCFEVPNFGVHYGGYGSSFSSEYVPGWTYTEARARANDLRNNYADTQFVWVTQALHNAAGDSCGEVIKDTLGPSTEYQNLLHNALDTRFLVQVPQGYVPIWAA